MVRIRLRLRPVEPRDRSFLYDVFCSTRPDVSRSNLPEAEKEYFLRMQFHAQDTHYRAACPEAQFAVVCLGNKKIGRIYTDRRRDEIRIMDIALMPEFRGRGFGSQLVKDVIAEAGLSRKAVRIHVELDSRQIQFYQRLGFVKIKEVPPRQLMEWSADSGIVLAE